MIEPVPLAPTPIAEVHLPRAPLARVIAQARFSPILGITRSDRLVGFQEALRETYPHLSREQVGHIVLSAGQSPIVREQQIWRLTDRRQEPDWRVSLGVGFVAVEAYRYESREDFLGRFDAVVAAVETEFRPAEATRLGLRYIDRLTGKAVERIHDLLRSDILGVIHGSQGSPTGDSLMILRQSIAHVMTEAKFLAQNGNQVHGRWGGVPSGATYDPSALEPVQEPSWVLDLDMFTSQSQPFKSGELLKTVTGFAGTLYWLFRQMVTKEFLRFYGGRA